MRDINVIGLTGGYATGKTFVASLLKKKGCAIISADKIGHGIIKPKTEVWKRIVNKFGKEILRRDGSVNRSKLSVIVFSDMGKIAVLNRITHPVIKKEIRKKISEAKAKNNVTAIVVEVPLLFESKMDKWFQKIIVVECDNVTQIKRAKKRSNISEEEILCRIKNQIPLEEKVKKADFVVDNNMPRKLVEKQVDDIMKMLK